MRIMIIEDDKIMASCIERAIQKLCSTFTPPTITIFTDAIQAMQQLDEFSPQLICLDVLLNGPDGFSFLHELRSYVDAMNVPVIVITSLDLKLPDLAHYGVVKVLQKETMTPEEIASSVQEAFSYA